MKFEHLIYGTFPELPGSQQVVYRSPGITDQLQSWLIQQYDQYGDCKTEDFRSALTLQWYRQEETPLASLTKVSQFGKDFSGRWGALLRHTATFSEQQFREFSGETRHLGDRLVSSGSSDELSQSGDLEIEAPSPLDHVVDRLLALDINHYKKNLTRLLNGERLVLYSDMNTTHVTEYLRNLITLVPLSKRIGLDWSELVFREVEELDLAVIFSSRYSAPDGDAIEFQSVGENKLGETALDEAAAEEYIMFLESAVSEKNRDALAALLEISN